MRANKVERSLDALQATVTELQQSVGGLQGSVGEILTLVKQGSQGDS